MAFDIVLMTTRSPKNQLDKEMAVLTTVTGTLKDNTSIIDPVIKIQCNLENVTNCNYMYISKFNRYYFVNDIVSITSNIIEISAHVDVLSTYKQEIRVNSGITKRQQNNWNLYLNDGSFKVYQNPRVVTKTFPLGFDTMEFVLAIAGS